MYGVTESGGPCTIHPDANSTQYNPYAFNKHVNMLYIDQPVGTGFSYDSLLNSTQDLLANTIASFDSYDESIPAENTTFLYGTFPSQDPTRTISTSQTAAKILWRFAQAWFTSFPEYTTSDKRVSLWGNSYGGYWVPATAAYIVEQNEKIKTSQLPDAYQIEIDTIGWTNGCPDVLVQGEYWPEMAYNNTYDFQAVSFDVYQDMKDSWTMPGGCRDLVEQCRTLGNDLDPDFYGTDHQVNAACIHAFGFCFGTVAQDPGNRSVFDIAHTNPDPFPYSYLIGFFNRAWVQQHLGVPVNFTGSSNSVFDNFFITGDFVRYEGLKTISALLNSGTKVAMIYGDRDYRCPWLGGEQLALQANWTDTDAFQKSGYETIKTSSCYNGGVVRQYGNLSFSRVFQAGHDAAAYQPRTVFEIFNRAMFDKDIATGTSPTNDERNDYASTGPLSSFGIRNKMPEPPPVNCHLYNVPLSCTTEQQEALANGTAVIQDFNVIKPDGGSAGVLGGNMV